MKKVLLVFAALTISFSLLAQEETAPVENSDILLSKKGNVILPQAGDIALGFNAIPLLDYALNFANIMNNTGQTAQHPGYVSGFNQIIVGKYFLEDNMAVRGRIGINTLSEKTTTYFNDPFSTAIIDIPQLENAFTEKNNNIVIGGGLELRRGHNRLQGFYGGEVLIAHNAYKEKYEYAIDYNQNAEDEGVIFGGSNRTLDYNAGGFGASLRAFVGVEYFFAPKISVSAEFGWGFGVGITGQTKETVEFWDDPEATGTNSRRTEEFLGATKVSALGFSVDNGSVGQNIFGGSGALSLLFHF